MEFGFPHTRRPRMSQTIDGKGLLMTYGKSVYSFVCNNPNDCYWKKEKYQLEIPRFYHIMMNIPSSLIENCNCKTDQNGTCICPTGVKSTNPEQSTCDLCQDGYWGFNLGGDKKCKSEFIKNLWISAGKHTGPV